MHNYLLRVTLLFNWGPRRIAVLDLRYIVTLVGLSLDHILNVLEVEFFHWKIRVLLHSRLVFNIQMTSILRRLVLAHSLRGVIQRWEIRPLWIHRRRKDCSRTLNRQLWLIDVGRNHQWTQQCGMIEALMITWCHCLVFQGNRLRWTFSGAHTTTDGEITIRETSRVPHVCGKKDLRCRGLLPS